MDEKLYVAVNLKLSSLLLRLAFLQRNRLLRHAGKSVHLELQMFVHDVN